MAACFNMCSPTRSPLQPFCSFAFPFAFPFEFMFAFPFEFMFAFPFEFMFAFPFEFMFAFMFACLTPYRRRIRGTSDSRPSWTWVL
jgi:hypothetical protein